MSPSTSSSRCPTCGQPMGEVLARTGEFAAITPAELAAVGEPIEEAVVDEAPLAADRARCSWCGKKADEVKKLLVGPSGQICNECVRLCVLALREELDEFNP